MATIGQGDDEIIIGGGAYTVLERPGEPLTAEVSFTVEEDYHGQGLSGLFMRLLTQIGRERGIRRFEAEVLAGNTPMLKVFQRSGLPMQSHVEDGVVHVVMELGPPAAMSARRRGAPARRARACSTRSTASPRCCSACSWC